MKRRELEHLIESLETENSMREMQLFKGISKKFRCPWLRWQIDHICHTDKIKGILIMQDWDCEMQTFADAIKCIKDQLARRPPRDNTIANLFESGEWKDHIEKGEILVTNAAWGIRPPKTNGSRNDKCGPLSANIHKTAFLTWGRLVTHISSMSNGENFRLFVAGAWGKFDNQPNNSGVKISAYMTQWKEWAKHNRGRITVFPKFLDQVSDCKGEVIFLSHPSTWNPKFEVNPFAPL